MDETKVFQQDAVSRFIDYARQLETFFAQQKIVHSTEETDLKLEIEDLKCEIRKKDDLIRGIQKKVVGYQRDLVKVVPEILEEDFVEEE